MRSAGLRALALGVLLSPACAGTRAPSIPPPAAPPAPAALTTAATPPPATTSEAAKSRLETLSTALDQALAAPTFARAQAALVVKSLASGETLYHRNGGTWLVPASTMKVLTSVAAAERLGWAYRFETRLVAMGPIVDGTLRGDLLVAGSGDPSITPRHDARGDAFEDWARALKAQGLRHIAGHVVGDDGAVEQPGWGVGWAWDDLVEGYGAAYAALQYREGEVAVTIGPGMTPGAPAVLYLSPAHHGLLVNNRAVTGPAGSEPALSLAREPGTRFLTVSGRAPLGGAGVTAVTAAANPTLYFTDELRAALVRHGIEVDGAAVDIDDLSDRPRAAAGRVLLVDQSPPLSEIVDVALKWSRNAHAEALLLALDATAPATAQEALAALRETLAGLGVQPEGYTTRDGSGLSRNDYLSADALVATLTAAWDRPHLRGTLQAALPQASRSGSLANRLKGTPAEARVWAKTGSMSNVRSLAGYVETAAGEPLVFAFLVNGFDAPAVQIDARVDEMLVAMVGLDR